MKYDIYDVLRQIEMPGYEFAVFVDGPRSYLQLRFWPTLSGDPFNPTPLCGRKWFLSPYMTKSEVVQTAFKAVITLIEHEAREAFLYKGRPVFGPHINVDSLWDACTNLDMRDEE